MEKREYTVYKFNELPKESRGKAIARYSDINTDHDWWEFVYDDADNIGLEITSFDCDAYCKGRLTHSPALVAQAILDNHGNQCRTYHTAKAYMQTIEILNDDHPDFIDLCEAAEEHFTRELLEDYRIMLRNEYEYITSEEAIQDTLVLNDYDFTLEGRID